MKKLFWIATTRHARQPQDTPHADTVEPIKPLSEHTLTDAELELVSGGGGNPASGTGGGGNSEALTRLGGHR